MWGFHDGMGWWMVFGGFWSIAFWAMVIWLVFWAANRMGTHRSVPPETESPLEVAKHRLARGEISREEFEELREILQ